jgi:hypothetical protein
MRFMCCGLDCSSRCLINIFSQQTQTALTAFWHLRGSPILAYETPVVGYPWSIPFEFPTFQILAAGLSLTGLSRSQTCHAGRLLSRLKSGTMLLADRGYDADWIRALASKRGVWANIPPRCNRNEPICFSPYLYRARNWSNGSSIGSNTVGGSRRATTNLRPTTWPSFSWLQYGCGYVLMSPRPSTTAEATKRVLVTGAGGLIGSHLVQALAQANWQVRARL